MPNTEQLALPLAGARDWIGHAGLSPEQRIYVNRSLNMTDIAWIGFDLDDTLAVYNHGQIDPLIVAIVIDRIRQQGYPRKLSEMQVDTSFAVRGLVVDTCLGNILKLSRHQIPTRGYHGLQPLSPSQLQYRSKKRLNFSDSNRFRELDTLWAVCEGSLYAALVHQSEQNNVPVDFPALFQFVRTCLEKAYLEGTISRELARNLPHVVQRDPMLAPLLHNLRSAGKKLFLLTNSPWNHVDTIMTYLVGDAMAEYPSWQHYFEVIVTSAAKPAFFYERNRLVALQQPPTSTTDDPAHNDRNRQCRVFEGGNVDELRRLLATQGERILFIGDHLHEDIQAAKRQAAWRTTMILPELQGELFAHQSSTNDLQRLSELDVQQAELEDELRGYRAAFKEQSRALDTAKQADNSTTTLAAQVDLKRVKRSVDRVRHLLRRVSAETDLLEQRIQNRFHPYWGSLLRDGKELTCYGHHIEQSACLYTNKVTNLLAYSPAQHFRGHRELMTHER